MVLCSFMKHRYYFWHIYDAYMRRPLKLNVITHIFVLYVEDQSIQGVNNIISTVLFTWNTFFFFCVSVLKIFSLFLALIEDCLEYTYINTKKAFWSSNLPPKTSSPCHLTETVTIMQNKTMDSSAGWFDLKGSGHAVWCRIISIQGVSGG